jgi:hypothetical protein
MVLSSRKAVKAARILNAELWVRRVRRPDAYFFAIRKSLFPDRLRTGNIPGVSTNNAVRICRVTSLFDLNHTAAQEGMV